MVPALRADASDAPTELSCLAIQPVLGHATLVTVRILRVYDPNRRPRDWSELVEPSQLVVFASLADGGVPCDFEGRPTTHEEALCALVETWADAEALCDDCVARHPGVRLDVFDAHGRSRPPLLTVVHPSLRRTLEGDAGTRRRQRRLAAGLIGLAPLLFWADWHYGLLGLPTLGGLNALVFAGRLLQLAAAYEAEEQRRDARVADRTSCRAR